MKWFSSYLTNRRRTPYYKIMNLNLNLLPTVFLGDQYYGPLLFLLYVNDIQHAITNAKIKGFADDTNLFFHSSDSIKLFTLANTGMLQLTDWFKVNKLSANIFTVERVCGRRQITFSADSAQKAPDGWSAQRDRHSSRKSIAILALLYNNRKRFCKSGHRRATVLSETRPPNRRASDVTGHPHC